MILIYILVLISLIAYYIWTYTHPYSWQKYKGDKKILVIIILLIVAFLVANMEYVSKIYNYIADLIMKGLKI